MIVSILIADAFALSVLLLIFFNIRHSSSSHLIEQKIFMVLVVCAMAIMVLDMGMWGLDGIPGQPVKILYYAVTVFYYIFNPLICMIWYFYVDYQIYESKKHLFTWMIPMLLPFSVNVVMSVLSPCNGSLFYIDERNIYHRGPLFYLMAVISLFYLVSSIVLTVLKRSQLKKNEFRSMLFFAFPPLLGGVVQSLHYGISLIWICATFSALVIFINMQNSQLYTDNLTGLFNRRQLQKFLRRHCQTGDSEMLAGIMIDLDSFKLINDLYGHHVGDEALYHTAEILKKTFGEHHFISRYGGDEFLILMLLRDKKELGSAIGALNFNIASFNEQKEVPYTIELSIGYDFYTGACEDDIMRFLNHIDELMYQDKQRQVGRRL